MAFSTPTFCSASVHKLYEFCGGSQTASPPLARNLRLLLQSHVLLQTDQTCLLDSSLFFQSASCSFPVTDLIGFSYLDDPFVLLNICKEAHKTVRSIYGWIDYHKIRKSLVGCYIDLSHKVLFLPPFPLLLPLDLNHHTCLSFDRARGSPLTLGSMS